MAEVKKRFDSFEPDGFANMHRQLTNKELMFDIDRVFADVTFNMSMRKENELFVEYNFSSSQIIFNALFEVKYKKTDFSRDALNPKNANSIARKEMCRRLGARLFVVYQTEGTKPFEFNEIDLNDGGVMNVHVLDYEKGQEKAEWRSFWRNTLRL